MDVQPWEGSATNLWNKTKLQRLQVTGYTCNKLRLGSQNSLEKVELPVRVEIIIIIRVERKEAWIQDNGDTIDNWSVRRWNEKRNGRVVECFKQKRAGRNRWPEKCRKRY